MISHYFFHFLSHCIDRKQLFLFLIFQIYIFFILRPENMDSMSKNKKVLLFSCILEHKGLQIDLISRQRWFTFRIKLANSKIRLGYFSLNLNAEMKYDKRLTYGLKATSKHKEDSQLFLTSKNILTVRSRSIIIKVWMSCENFNEK